MLRVDLTHALGKESLEIRALAILGQEWGFEEDGGRTERREKTF